MPGTRSPRGGGLVDRGHRIGNQIGWIGNQTQTDRGGIVAGSSTPGKGMTRVDRQGAEAPGIT